MRHLGRAALTFALVTGLAVSAASAQTSNPAAAPASKPAKKPHAARVRPASIAEACDVDMALYCGDLEAKGARVAKCLSANKSSVSQGCGAALGGKSR